MRTPARLEQLTGLRFFAALFVLLSHLEFLQDPGSPIRGLASTVFREGYCGVTFFYVLSGFILSHTYGDQLSAGEISRWRYLMLRVVRIFPLHLAIALPFALLALKRSGAGEIPTIALNFTLLQSWSSDRAVHFSLNSVSWSLSDELFFYTAFIWLVACGSRTLLALAVAWALAAATYAAALGAHPAPEAGHWALYVMPLTRLLDFMVGMLMYRLFLRQEASNAAVSTISVRWTFIELAVIAGLLAAMFAFPRYGVPQTWRYELAYLPIMTASVYIFALGRGLLSRGLATPLAVFLGNASFALYMIHQPLTLRAGYLARVIHDPLLLAAAVIVICVGASAVVYHYAENPVHRYLRRRLATRAVRRPTSAVQL
jgi:peptidoglycan/LPS O-acetylase OafA/YrhL